MQKVILDGKHIMGFDFLIDQNEALHFHQSIEILYVLEGNPLITIQDKKYQAHPEDILVVNANKKHGYHSEDEVLIGCFEVDYRMLGNILDTNQLIFWCNSIMNKNTAYDDMRNIMKRIFGIYFEKSGYGKLILQSMYYHLLKILLENFMVLSEDRRFEDEKNQDEDRIAEIVNYVHNNYKKKIRLTELSEELYLSVPYLSKYIKRKMGMNFIDYVNSIRLYHAVEELLYTNNSITMIALESGFANVAAFTELFKRTYNTSPSVYRQKMRNSIKKDSEQGTKLKKVLEKKVSDYLENTAVPSMDEVECEDDYIIVNTNDRRENSHYWSQMINIGRVEELLRSDLREQILLFKNELGFRYLRMWDIFSPNMMLNESGERGDYHFDRLDHILDFLVDNQIKPYFELGYKPRLLHETLTSQLVADAQAFPFTNQEQFERFLQAFIAHLINRYGIEEVESWYFEQWSGEEFDSNTYDPLFWPIFNSTYRIIKSYSKSIKVGGGGIGIQYGSSNLKKLISDWEKQPYYPDFVTLYCYPYIRGDGDGVAYARQSADRDFLKNQLDMAGNVIQNSKLKDVDIHVSEWNSTISNRNILNDSCYKGAYIMKSIIDCYDKVKILGYWLGSDIFAEHVDVSHILFGGCGLLSVNGIKKPAYYTYRFLKMQGKYLIHNGQNCQIATNGNNNYSVVCHNYRHLNYKYHLKKENELELNKIHQFFEDSVPRKQNFQLNNLKNGKYKIKTYSVNDSFGSAQEEWHKLGQAEQLSKTEIEYLKRISTPHIQIRTCQVTDHVLNFETKLQAHEIQYIHISYLYE